MLAPTRELATALNIRARTDRLTRLHAQPGPQVLLADGSAACAGDPIITRRNDRRLRTSATDWVKNGDRWTVTQAHSDGSLDVAHLHTGRRITLTGEYVRQHVQLGYATTIHGGQGVTADTSHTITTGSESRQQLYVALSRGRDTNHLYLVTAGDGDEHTVITPAATHPLTAINILEQILARDEAQLSATTTAPPAGRPRRRRGRRDRPLPRQPAHRRRPHPRPRMGQAPGHRPRAAAPRHQRQPRLPHAARAPGPARRRRARPHHHGHRRLDQPRG